MLLYVAQYDNHFAVLNLNRRDVCYQTIHNHFECCKGIHHFNLHNIKQVCFEAKNKSCFLPVRLAYLDLLAVGKEGQSSEENIAAGLTRTFSDL